MGDVCNSVRAKPQRLCALLFQERWLLLLRSSATLILVRPAEPLHGFRVELVEPPPEETWRLKGPFTRVELSSDQTTLRFFRSMTRVEPLHLPCREAALVAFTLAAENVFRG
ncbi:unnamed protein product [Durusdinium trenchii]|uniref:Uncharacterized protein n=1 Tax=Durusdinium trenchii TaxID=1381693 RepID=A0ABP0N4P3_9DINO